MAGEKALSRCISSSSRRPARLSMSHQRPGSRLASSSSSSTSSSTAPSSSSSSSITPPNFTFAPTSRAAKVPKALINDSTPASELSKTFNLTAHPHASSYAALLSRIAGAEGLQNNLQLVEACCICPSFWSDVDTLDAANAKGPFTLFHDQDRLDNRQLSSLGNALLGLFATEWLERRMPNLPTSVLKSALTMFVGPHTAADVARTWGVLPGKASFQPTQPSSESAATSKGCVRERKSSVRGQGEGWRAGTGVLRWSRQPVSEKDTGLELWQNGSSFQDAMASVAKAFVGAVHQEMGLAAARDFVHAHFLSRQADIHSLLKFTNPKNILQATMLKHDMGSLETRLLRETGRTSIAPVFVVGTFVAGGTRKLGEGIGSSLKMAEYRACEDALRRLYLSTPGGSELDQQEEQQRLPSDALCGQEWIVQEQTLGSDEVEDLSSGRRRATVAKASEQQSPWAARQAALRAAS